MQYISYFSPCYKIPDSNLREGKFILARELRIRHGGERCGVHGGGSVGLFTFPPVLLLSGQGGGCWHFPGFFFSPFSSVQGPIPWNGAIRITVGLPSLVKPLELASQTHAEVSSQGDSHSWPHTCLQLMCRAIMAQCDRESEVLRK